MEVGRVINPLAWGTGKGTSYVKDTYTDKMRRPGGGVESLNQNVQRQLRAKHGSRFFGQKSDAWWTRFGRGRKNTLNIRSESYSKHTEEPVFGRTKTYEENLHLADFDAYLKDTNLDLFTESQAPPNTCLLYTSPSPRDS